MRIKQTNNQTKRDKIEQVKSLLEGYLLSPEWEAYQKMSQLSQSEIAAIQVRWNKYYGGVKETMAYKRFWEMRELYKNQKFGELKKLALEAKADRERGFRELVKPSSFDPEWLENCWPVKRAKALQKYLTKLESKDESDYMSDLLNSK